MSILVLCSTLLLRDKTSSSSFLENYLLNSHLCSSLEIGFSYMELPHQSYLSSLPLWNKQQSMSHRVPDRGRNTQFNPFSFFWDKCEKSYRLSETSIVTVLWAKFSFGSMITFLQVFDYRSFSLNRRIQLSSTLSVNLDLIQRHHN